MNLTKLIKTSFLVLASILILTNCGDSDIGITGSFGGGGTENVTARNITLMYGDKGVVSNTISYYGTNISLSEIDFTILEESTPKIGTFEDDLGRDNYGSYNIKNIGTAKIGYALKGHPTLSNTFTITVTPRDINQAGKLTMDAIPDFKPGRAVSNLIISGLIGMDKITNSALFEVSIKKGGAVVSDGSVTRELTSTETSERVTNEVIVRSTSAVTSKTAYQFVIKGHSNYTGEKSFSFNVDPTAKDFIRGAFTYSTTVGDTHTYGDAEFTFTPSGSLTSSEDGSMVTPSYALSVHGGGTIPAGVEMDSTTGIVKVTNNVLPVDVFFDITLTADNHQDRVLANAIHLVIAKKPLSDFLSDLNSLPIATIGIPSSGVSNRLVTLPSLLHSDAYTATDFDITLTKKESGTTAPDTVTLDVSQFSQKKVTISVSSTIAEADRGIRYTLKVAAKNANSKYSSSYKTDFTIGKPRFIGVSYPLTSLTYGYSAQNISQNSATRTTDDSSVGTLFANFGTLPNGIPSSMTLVMNGVFANITLPTDIEAGSYTIPVIFTNKEETVLPTTFYAKLTINKLQVTNFTVTNTDKTLTTFSGSQLNLGFEGLAGSDKLNSTGFTVKVVKPGATTDAPNITARITGPSNVLISSTADLTVDQYNLILDATTHANYTGTNTIPFSVVKQSISGSLGNYAGLIFTNRVAEVKSYTVPNWVITSITPAIARGDLTFTVSTTPVDGITSSSDGTSVTSSATTTTLGKKAMTVTATVKDSNPNYQGSVTGIIYHYVMPKWIKNEKITFTLQANGRLTVTCATVATDQWNDCYAFSAEDADQVNFLRGKTAAWNAGRGALGIVTNAKPSAFVPTDSLTNLNYGIAVNARSTYLGPHYILNSTATDFPIYWSSTDHADKIVTMTIADINSGADHRITYTATAKNKDIVRTVSPKIVKRYPMILMYGGYTVSDVEMY